MPIFETPPWGVVVPVKLLSVAKSRLAPYGEAARRRLALAFAADVVTAAMRSRLVVRVVVVTDDPVAAQALTSIGAVVVADEPAAGLNPALGYGAELLRASLPDCGVAALSSDLPALRADDLDTVLAAVPAPSRAFVPDAERLGTTLLAASPGLGLDPAYGAPGCATWTPAPSSYPDRPACNATSTRRPTSPQLSRWAWGRTRRRQLSGWDCRLVHQHSALCSGEHPRPRDRGAC